MLNGFLAAAITGDVPKFPAVLDSTQCEDQSSSTTPASARGSRPSRALLYENMAIFV